MKTEIINLPGSEIEIKFQIPVQEWQVFLEETIKKLSENLKIKGFRPGFAPFELVEKKIGIQVILDTAAENCVKKYYTKTILENNIEAIGKPEVSILKLAKNSPFEFKVRVAVMPKIKMPDYKKIASQIKKNKVSVEEKEIEETLFWLQKSKAKFSQKLGPCKFGDWVEIKLKIKEISTTKSPQKSKISEQEIKDAFILGQGKLIPGLEKKIEGMAAGEEKEFPLVFPKNHYQKELAGKTVNFWLKVESVQKIELPEINDFFAQSLGNFKNLASLKQSLKEGINLEKEMAETQRVREIVLQKIIQESEIKVPEILINSLKLKMLDELKKKISQKLGITYEEYLRKIKKNKDELLTHLSHKAEENIKRSLILLEISKREKISISQEEIEEMANEILKNNFGIHKNLDPKQLKDYTESIIRENKVIQLLDDFLSKN